MKKHCVLFSCFFVLLLNAQTIPAGDFFYTVPLNTQINLDDNISPEWWHEYMEPSQKIAFLQPILDLVDSGRVTAYVPEFPYTKKISQEEIHSMLNKSDTSYTDMYNDDGSPYFIITHYPLSAEDIESISFHEQWQYDSIAKTLKKNVLGITLNSTSTIDFDFDQGVPLFYIRFDGKGIKNGPSVLNPSVISGFTYDFHTRDFNHKSYSSDLLFGKDIPFQLNDQKEANLILRSIIKGKKLIFYDTIYPYYNPIDKKISKTRMPVYQSANAMRFFEDWNVDLIKMTFTKTVHGIVLEKESELDPEQLEKPILFTRIAFLPLNGYVPAPMVYSNKEIVPDFIYRQTFFPFHIARGQQTIFSDSAQLMNLCVGICNLAESNKLPAYDVVDSRIGYGEKLYWTKQQSDSIFAEAHKTKTYPQLESFATIPFYYQTIGGLGFTENWYYNSSTQVFGKEIETLTLTYAQYIIYDEGDVLLPLFSVDPPKISDTAAIMKPEFLVAKNISSPVMIDYNLETDGSERRYAPEAFANECVMFKSQRYIFVQQIINDALAGKIKVYDGEKPETLLTPIQLRTKIDSLKDSSFVRLDLPTDYLLFQEIVFVEDWYFNPATGAFYKKVNEIVFVNTTDDNTSYNIDFDHQKKVFCIKTN